MGNAQEQVISTYRARARRYDLVALAYPPGFRQRRYRRKAVDTLRLRRGDTVVEIGCGTGLNLPLIQQVIGPEGRIVGVDLTDAMLAQAHRRVQTRGWGNVSLVRADASGFEFPAGTDAILSTFALSLVPDCAEVIASGGAALRAGGRWVVLDFQLPPRAPRWLVRGALAIVRPYGGTEEVLARRPWDAIRAAMSTSLVDVSYTDLFFGFLFLAEGTRQPGH